VKFFWSFFWTFILVEMVTYVGSSMLGTELDLKLGAILSIPVIILIYVIAAILPNDPVENGQH
jgi:hypothetical protein